MQFVCPGRIGLGSSLFGRPFEYATRFCPQPVTSCMQAAHQIRRSTHHSAPLKLQDTMTNQLQDQEHTSLLAQKLCHFIDVSPSPYHAVESAAALLRKAGYSALSETDNFAEKIEPGGKYFSTRNGSSLVAFAVGEAYDPSKAHVVVLGAHTDSPCFRVKPISNVNKHGYVQLGVETYGSGLWYTWFDRDLTVAGRVVLRDGTVRRAHLKRPICRISNLAIHLNRKVNEEGFKPNKETHCTPIMATEALEETLLADGSIAKDKEARSKDQLRDKSLATDRHSPRLLQAISAELGVSSEQIIDLELCLSDTQPAAIGGVSGEFIFAPRLDNLASCFAGLEALISSAKTLVSETGIRMVSIFDHEEVGSVSAVGAASSFLPDHLERIFTSLRGSNGQKALDRAGFANAVRRSLCVSADMAHAVHPNYSSKHESNHRVALGGGLVIKTNSNQRYTTSLVTGCIVRECARAVKSAVQEYVVPNDLGCGSTIGPTLSARTGMRTVDVGMPQLSMHSAREMGSLRDISNSISVYKGIFEHFRSVDGRMNGAEIVD